MKRSFILAIVCIVATIAVFLLTRKKESDLEKSVEFKLVKTFGAETEPKEAMLSRVFYLNVDNNKNIYILDNSERLVSFAHDGTLRWQVNKIGKGPGDIDNPRGIALDGDKFLYLSNINGTRIDKYDLNGNYINSLNTGDIKQNYLSVIGFIQPNLLVTSKSLFGKIGSEILILDIDNKYSIKNQFVIDRTGGLKLPKNGNFGFSIGISGNKIATGNLTEYKLSFYNADGKEEKVIKKSVKNLFLVYTSEKMSGIAGSISRPYKIKENYYLVYMNAPSNVTEMSQLLNRDFKREYATTIDIYNEAGNLVYSKKTEGRTNPEIGQPIYSDSEGYLYTFKEMPYPQICKYQVIISDKK